MTWGCPERPGQGCADAEWCNQGGPCDIAWFVEAKRSQREPETVVPPR